MATLQVFPSMRRVALGLAGQNGTPSVWTLTTLATLHRTLGICSHDHEPDNGVGTWVPVIISNIVPYGINIFGKVGAHPAIVSAMDMR